MATVFKLVAVVTTLATTGLLAFESAQRGALVLGTVLGIIKLIVFVAFCTLLLVIIYMLLVPDNQPEEEAPSE